MSLSNSSVYIVKPVLGALKNRRSWSLELSLELNFAVRSRRSWSLELSLDLLELSLAVRWISKELDLLQNYIDKANEKGWRSQLSVYLERRQLLQTPSEQSRLLQQIPKVASIAEPEPMADDATKEDETDDSLNPIGASVEEKLQSEVTFQTEQRPGNDMEPRTVQNKEVSPPLELIDFSSSDGGEDIGVAAMKEEEPCQTTKSITASFDLEPITARNTRHHRLS